MFKRSAAGQPKAKKEKKDRMGHFFFQIFGPATVEGAIQGWSPEARNQYKEMRERQNRAAEAQRQQQRGEAGTVG